MKDFSHIFKPGQPRRMVLHSCCAVCSCSIVERLREWNISCTVYFYNPNIHPQEEYNLRRDEHLRFAAKREVHLVEGGYEPDLWHKRIRGLEECPERGERCAKCFDLRMEKTARYAQENDFTVFATSLGISRYKDVEQVNRAGKTAADLYPGIVYWDHNWRKKGGSQRMSELSKEENFYRQRYCGCCYSRNLNNIKYSSL